MRILECIAAGIAIVALAGAASAQSPKIIDTHTHVDGHAGQGLDYAGAAKSALAAMDKADIVLALLLPPPQPPNFPREWECDGYKSLPREFGRRFALVCGGGTISPLILRHATDRKAAAGVESRIAELVERFVGLGAVGLGEFTAEHFSFNPRHPYISAPADHALFRHLADLAARHRLPIDFHMEAATTKFAFPEGIRRMSPHNPTTLAPNIERFERLIAHNRGAIIVWAHAGWDNTRQRTVALMREMLARHPNLYMSIAVHASGPGSQPYRTSDGNFQPAFLALIEEFADRFTIGIDGFFTHAPTHASIQTQARIEGTLALLRKLSPAAAQRVAYDNAVQIYRLRERGIVR